MVCVLASMDPALRYGPVMIVEASPYLQNPWIQSMLAAFEHATESVIITSTGIEQKADRFLYANQSFLRRTGYSEAELRGKTPRILQGKKTNPAVSASLREVLGRGDHFIGQNTNYRKDGSEYIVRWYISPLRDPDGEIVAWFSLQKEVSPKPDAREEALFLSAVLNQTADSIIVTDLKGDIVFVNAAFTHMTGYQSNDVCGQNARVLQSGKQSRSFYADLWQALLAGKTYRNTFINRRKNGELFFEEATISPIYDHNGEPLYYVAIGKDVTELMQQSEDNAQKAYHDALTGMYNRLKLDEVLARKLNETWPRARLFSLILLDIDNFKRINDDFGHAMGDEVLKQLATLLQTTLRHNDLLVRWGGEELVLLVDDGAEQALCVAEKMCVAIAEHPFDPRFQITASFGVTEVREGDDAVSLFERADVAVYQSKDAGKNRVTLG